LEIDKEKDTVKRKAIVKAFIELLLENIYGKESVKPFVTTLLESRWSPIKEIFEVLVP
jgi:DNA replicative helicase MCM subunit Mcm2 (Cdc46/Mcm family)